MDFKKKLYSTEELDEIAREFAIEQFTKDKIVISISNAKRYKRSFSNRLKKAEEVLLDLNGKNEIEGLTEEEFKQKDAVENEIEELNEVLKKLK